MKIKTLIENTAALPDLKTEHGLSILIETNGRTILFDTGQSEAFADNAKQMNVNLAKVDYAVLSHGHYDHGGGLQTFFSLNAKAPIYLSQYAFEDHLHGKDRYIGLNLSLRGNSRFIYTQEYCKIADGLELFSCTNRKLKYPIRPDGLTVRQNDKILPEDFRHEQYLLVTEGSKSVLFSGCSHKGILNIMQWFSPDVLVGGFHFMNLDPKTDDHLLLDSAAAELLQYETAYYTCHCTGVEQYNYMKPKMDASLHYLAGGETVNL